MSIKTGAVSITFLTSCIFCNVSGMRRTSLFSGKGSCTFLQAVPALSGAVREDPVFLTPCNVRGHIIINLKISGSTFFFKNQPLRVPVKDNNVDRVPDEPGIRRSKRNTATGGQSVGDPALQSRRRAVVEPGPRGLFSRVHGEQAHVCVIGVKT